MKKYSSHFRNWRCYPLVSPCSRSRSTLRAAHLGCLANSRNALSISHIVLVCTVFALTGCTSQWDMHGVDPKEFYAEHPIKNTIEMHDQAYQLHFDSADIKLSPDSVDELRDQLHGISMEAVQSVQIELSKADMKNEARKASLLHLLRAMGYNKGNVQFIVSSDLYRGDMQLLLTYATVVSPDCPDWRRSPVTSYSNTLQGNFKCSQEVNLGLMVADPRDLERGTDNMPPDTAERASKALQDYRAGVAAAPPVANASTASTSSAVAAGVGAATGGGSQ